MWRRERSEPIDLEDVLTAPTGSLPVTPPRAAAAPTPDSAVASPLVSPPSSAPIAAASRGSVLGATLRFKGELVADEDLLVEGQVEGSILHTRSLTIGALGCMRGDIRARRVIVEGTVQGNLHALESVTIRPGATVNGDVYAQRVAIEQGARLCGRIDMDNAPAVPRIGAAGGGTADQPRELTDREVGELLAGS